MEGLTGRGEFAKFTAELGEVGKFLWLSLIDHLEDQCLTYAEGVRKAARELRETSALSESSQNFPMKMVSPLFKSASFSYCPSWTNRRSAESSTSPPGKENDTEVDSMANVDVTKDAVVVPEDIDLSILVSVTEIPASNTECSKS